MDHSLPGSSIHGILHVSREVPGSVLKCETLPDSFHATPKSPPHLQPWQSSLLPQHSGLRADSLLQPLPGVSLPPLKVLISTQGKRISHLLAPLSLLLPALPLHLSFPASRPIAHVPHFSHAFSSLCPKVGHQLKCHTEKNSCARPQSCC